MRARTPRLADFTTAVLAERGRDMCRVMEGLEEIEPEAMLVVYLDDLDVAPEAVAAYCPALEGVVGLADGAIAEDDWVVGGDVAAGTYRTHYAPVTDCYWERSRGDGSTIANDFITNAPEGVTVTLSDGEGFSSSGCGPWVPAG